jgi:alkaline phosphatase
MALGLWDICAMMVRFALAGLWLAGFGLSAQAQTIYPIDRAEILVGSRFDLKVEFPGTPDVKDLKVTINGEDAAKALGVDPKDVQVVEREDGGDYTAVWLRQVALTAAGTFKVEAAAGNRTAEVSWQAFDTPKGRVAKNVILFVGDGLSVAHRTAARMLSKGIKEGRYGGELAMDDMPHMALVSTHGSDAIVTDSANSASAYMTGHKTCVNAMGLYCSRNKAALDHPKVETIAELVQRKHGLAVGIVTNTEIQDATPAAMVAHTRNRRDYNDIIPMFFRAQPEVMLGGGTPNFLPASEPTGKRPDGEDYIAKFKSAGYAFAATDTEMKAAASQASTKKLLGLFNKSNIDGALDRRILKAGTVPLYPDQPDLTDQVRSALEVLSRNEKGFVLMVESGRIDKYSHSLDWERAVYDTIMLDNAVQVAKDFAAKDNDTLIIVVPDHAHPVSIVGTYDNAAPGDSLRDKLQVYDRAKFPNYFPPDAQGYPPTIDVSRRLAFVFAAYPDHCDAGQPYIAGENQPTVKGPDGKSNLANEANCKPQATRRFGNLPLGAPSGVHSADDVILTAMGPGADQFRGRIDNTRVFRAMAIALGLGSAAKP